jgi:demethylmenaquinone methyltransferase/2-methoxy-6-polyprenyl-1,4-benzoquinol methylase
VKQHAEPLRQPDEVREMFGSIARRYDLSNHVLSCGCDFYWRRRAAKIVASWRPDAVLDLATGTGDLALALKRQMPKAEITASDFSEEMLAIAKSKGVGRTVMADAMNLPFADAEFDCVTISFGLRNFPDWSGALREMSRVIKPGGHLLVLEFSLPTLPVARAGYRFYLHRCMPVIGSFLTKKKSAYDYLGKSIEQFPSGDAMLQLMAATGFSNAVAEPLTVGVVSIYTAEKEGADAN